MNRITIGILICIASFVVAAPVDAQTKTALPDGTVRLTLEDGTVVVGVVEREDEAEIVLRTTSGVLMTIPRDQVKSRVDVGGERYLRIDPNRTRLFFAPTGRAVGSGSGYVAFYEIFVPFVAVGVGSAVTLAGGVTINPGTARLAYVAPKVTVLDRRTTSVGVGGIGAIGLGDDGGASVGLLYAVSTFGPPHASLTTGIAFGFADGEIGRKPILMLGAELQMSNSVKLLTENYLFVGINEGVLVSGGIRFFNESIAADIGLITAPFVFGEDIGFPFLPWIGFAYNFGR